jgi:DNA-binding transcriptional ArsR family regulator
MNALSKILSSKVRAEIFRVLFGLNAEEIHMREIERRTGFAIGTIQSELKKLLQLDLLAKRRDGNRLYYRANREHPLYPDIRSIVLKTVGLFDILRDALDHGGGIAVAFVFGSLAADRENARSDVDLVVIGDAGPRDVSLMLSAAAEKIGREINPIVLTQAEFAKRLQNQDHFIGRIMEAPKLFIVGGENDLAAMGR